MHPKLRGSTVQGEGKAEITRRRSLYDSQPEDDFGEADLHERWLQEQADADPADFAELDSSADSRAEALERRLMQQIQEHTREQQQAMEAKVTSLEGTLDIQLNTMQEQQARLEAKMERQAEESNKRLDQLLALVTQQHQQQPH